jgi:hypothetical protein
VRGVEYLSGHRPGLICPLAFFHDTVAVLLRLHLPRYSRDGIPNALDRPAPRLPADLGRLRLRVRSRDQGLGLGVTSTTHQVGYGPDVLVPVGPILKWHDWSA